MKTYSMLLIILGGLMIVVFGLMYLFGFVMSFDAPGSESDPGAWSMRLFMFLPLIAFMVVLVFAWMAYLKGNYVRSFRFGLVFVVVPALVVIFGIVFSLTTMGQLRQSNAQEAKDAVQYPIQKFIRPARGGVDTIIVFPSRIVAYRLYTGKGYPYAGPVGNLNKSRDTIIADFGTDTLLRRADLPLFIDEKGRKLTDVYSVR